MERELVRMQVPLISCCNGMSGMRVMMMTFTLCFPRAPKDGNGCPGGQEQRKRKHPSKREKPAASSHQMASRPKQKKEEENVAMP